jgi:hypothetical protein
VALQESKEASDHRVEQLTNEVQKLRAELESNGVLSEKRQIHHQSSDVSCNQSLFDDFRDEQQLEREKVSEAKPSETLNEQKETIKGVPSLQLKDTGAQYSLLVETEEKHGQLLSMILS